MSMYFVQLRIALSGAGVRAGTPPQHWGVPLKAQELGRAWGGGQGDSASGQRHN
jgi:hypothetical protein